MYRTDWRETIDRQKGRYSTPLVSDKQVEQARNLVLGLTQQMNARAHDGKWSPGETAVMAIREISKMSPKFKEVLKVGGVIDGKGNLSGNFLSGLERDFTKKLTGLDSRGINKLQKEFTKQVIGDLITAGVSGGLPPQLADVIKSGLLDGLDKAPKISGVDVKGAGKNSANLTAGDLNSYYKSFDKSKPRDVALSKMKGKDLFNNSAPQVDQQVSMSELFQDPDGRDIFDLFNGVSAEEKNPNIGGIYKNEGFSFVNMVTQQRTAARGRSNIQFNRKPAGFSL